jgi:hypothetical protein
MAEANQDELDGCDVLIQDQGETLDEELPAAEGGVAINQDELDGCDVLIQDQGETLDEELPAAEGGVA